MTGICLAAVIHAETSFDVPLNNPVYRYIDMLPLPPRVSGIDLSIRPLTEAHICTVLVYIRREKISADTAVTRFFLRQFARSPDGAVQRKVLGTFLFDSSRTSAYPYVNTGINFQDSGFTPAGFTASRIDSVSVRSEFYNRTAVGAKLYSSIDRFLFCFDGAILTGYSSAGTFRKIDDPHRGEAWASIMGDSTGKSHLMGYDSYIAYVKVPAPWFDLKVGNDRVQWGHADTSGLFLSGSGRPFLQIKLDRTFGSLNYSFLVGKLVADTYAQKRVIYAKRLTYTPKPWLTLGFSDGVIVAQGGIEPLYLMPFVPYYFTEHDRGSPDNRIQSFDGKVLVGKRCAVYGEFFLDDISSMIGMFTNKNFGDKWAGLIGMKLFNPLPIAQTSLLKIEAVQIEPWVYTTSVAHGQNYPLNFGAVIGNNLGPHSRSLSADLSCRVSKMFGAALGIRQYWRGMGPGSSVFDTNSEIIDTLPDSTIVRRRSIPEKAYRFTTLSRSRTVLSVQADAFLNDWLILNCTGALAFEREPETVSLFQVGVNLQVNY